MESLRLRTWKKFVAHLLCSHCGLRVAAACNLSMSGNSVVTESFDRNRPL